ncbi:MAG: FAD-dependent oxidoreductase [Candidatus Omnitrophica bacterium]|nr:FAD-dependent oxidoreductase [Candidatus Omnitrophota bacterium]
MNKVIIIGGGFGGLTALRKLAPFKRCVDLTLVDKKTTSDFLPELPDRLGRGVRPEYLTCPLEATVKRYGQRFINEEVKGVDLEKRLVNTTGSSLAYDYLIIASGSETNFYGNGNIRGSACKLDDVADTETIYRKLKEKQYAQYIIAGGGYTGIEIASNMRLFLKKEKRHARIVIVERAPSILGPLPAWMRAYVSSNLAGLAIDIIVDSQIQKIEGDKVFLSGGRVFDGALVIWAAGVRTADFIQDLKVKKNPQGRVEVDEYLRIDERSFVVGDAAYVRQGAIVVRMAVQFAIAQADSAAKNIIRAIHGKDPRKYTAIDMGYVIPMANNRSCGNVLGMNVRGWFATLLHFLMCLYRSYSVAKGFGIFKGLFIETYCDNRQRRL